MPGAMYAQKVADTNYLCNHQVLEQEQRYELSVIKSVNTIFTSSSLKSSTVGLNVLDSAYKCRFNTPSDSVIVRKIYYSDDVANHKTLEKFYNLDTVSNQAQLSHYFEYVYDSAGKNTLQKKYHWVDSLDSWIEANEYEYTFDSLGRLVSLAYKKRVYDPWVSSYVWNTFLMDTYIYSFDQNGNRVDTLHYHKLTFGYLHFWGWEEYYENFKSVNRYDSIGNVISIDVSKYYWLLPEPQKWFWYGSYKYEYEYNSDSTIKTLQYSYWSSVKKNWVAIFRAEYAYGAKGNKNSYVYYALDTVTNQFVNLNKVEYVYTVSGKNVIKNGYSWDKVGNKWVISEKEYFYYRIKEPVLPNNLNYSRKIETTLYPNPAKNSITLKNDDNNSGIASVYNLNGALIKTFAIIPGMNNLNVSQLPKGLYIVHFSNSKGVEKYKFLKE